MTASIPLAWLGTYLIHSTLLLGAVWVVTRWLGRRSNPLSLALEERLWKTALVGGLLTATLQIGLAYAPGVEPPTLASWGREAVPERTVPNPVPLAAPAAAIPTGAPTALPSLATSVRPHPGLATMAALLPGWQRLVLAAWLLGGAAGLGLLALSWVGLQRTLRGRRTLGDGETRRALDRLLSAHPTSRPVRLTASDRLPVPIAFGLFEREICVPERALESFGPRRQEGLLAHELAHLERRDPAWTLALRTLEAALFLQPLNRVARRRLLEISEDRSDAWAVEQTGDRVGLARSLTDVATWLAGLEPRPLTRPLTDRLASPVPGMAGDRRSLGRRVRRILSGPAEGDRTPGRWSLPLAAAALLAVGCLAPGIAPVVSAETVAEDPPAAETTIHQDESDEATELAEAVEAAEQAARAEAAERAERRGEWEGREVHGHWDPDEHPEHLEALEHLTELESLQHLEHLEHLEALEQLEHMDLDFEIDPELGVEIERLAAQAEELARRAQPDLEALAEVKARLDEVVAESMALHEESLEQLHETLARELADLETVHEMSAEERERLEAELARLGEEAAHLAERARPSEEELERLREDARRIAEEARPSREEIERMNREVERMNRELRELNRDELRQMEEQVRQNREEIERRVRDEVRRELDAERARLAEEREALRAERRRMEEEREALEREAEERERSEPPR